MKALACSSVNHHRPDPLAAANQIEAVVYFLERQHMRDQIIDVDLSVHVPIDNPRHIGPAACAAKRSAHPGPPSHQLEWPRGNLLPRAGDANDDGLAPAAMRAL